MSITIALMLFITEAFFLLLLVESSTLQGDYTISLHPFLLLLITTYSIDYYINSFSKVYKRDNY